MPLFCPIIPLSSIHPDQISGRGVLKPRSVSKVPEVPFFQPTTTCSTNMCKSFPLSLHEKRRTHNGKAALLGREPTPAQANQPNTPQWTTPGRKENLLSGFQQGGVSPFTLSQGIAQPSPFVRGVVALSHFHPYSTIQLTELCLQFVILRRVNRLLYPALRYLRLLR